MGPELPAPWLLLFTWLPTGEPWGNGSHPGAQGDGKPLLPGLAELATGWAVEAWAAVWLRQEVRGLDRVSACGNLLFFSFIN